GAASFDAPTGILRLTVNGSGMPLSVFGPGDAFALIPRFFAAGTEDAPDLLATPSAVRLEFQAAPATPTGDPDVAQASAWVASPSALSGSTSWSFLRFRVTFELVAPGTPLQPDLPRPTLDFLRVPFRF